MKRKNPNALKFVEESAFLGNYGINDFENETYTSNILLVSYGTR